MKTFIIIFVLAVLFVIGSASAMRYFGGRRPGVDNKRKQKPDKDS